MEKEASSADNELQNALIRLAKSDPCKLFKNLWKKDGLKKRADTLLWTAVYQYFGAPWKDSKYFSKMNIMDKNNMKKIRKNQDHHNAKTITKRPLKSHQQLPALTKTLFFSPKN